MNEWTLISTSLSNALRAATSGELNTIPPLLAELEVDVENVRSDLAIKDKTLEEANREQPDLFFKYHIINQKLKSVCKMVENKIDFKKSNKYKQYKQGTNVALNTTDLNQWVNGDTEIHSMYTVLILLQDYAYQYEAIVKAFEMRGYSLKNVTESRINQINGLVIS